MLSVIGLLFIGCMAVSPHEGASAQIIGACLPETYIPIGRLYEFCHVPGRCGEPLQCEGQTALVKGAIDYGNVFEHSRYPRLPYEKFLLSDENGATLDVLAVSSDNAALFKKISAARTDGKKEAFIKGTILGFDAPVMGACHREIRLEMDSPEDIYFR